MERSKNVVASLTAPLGLLAAWVAFATYVVGNSALPMLEAVKAMA